MEQKLNITIIIYATSEEICIIIKQSNTSKGKKIILNMFDELLALPEQSDIIEKGGNHD